MRRLLEEIVRLGAALFNVLEEDVQANIPWHDVKTIIIGPLTINPTFKTVWLKNTMVVERDTVYPCGLINAYSKIKNKEKAKKVFNKLAKHHNTTGRIIGEMLSLTFEAFNHPSKFVDPDKIQLDDEIRGSLRMFLEPFLYSVTHSIDDNMLIHYNIVKKRLEVIYKVKNERIHVVKLYPKNRTTCFTVYKHLRLPCTASEAEHLAKLVNKLRMYLHKAYAIRAALKLWLLQLQA